MRYLTITSPDVNNGKGFRVTLWVAGCTHRCPGCQNPSTWAYNQGMELSEIKDQLFEKLDKPYVKGLSLSGGDPLDQTAESLAELRDLLIEVKKRFPEKDIWLYSGDYLKDVWMDKDKWGVISQCDFMVDGPFIKELADASLPFRGSSNQGIIDINDYKSKI